MNGRPRSGARRASSVRASAAVSVGESLGVRPVGGGVLRVGLGERRGDRARRRDRVRRGRARGGRRCPSPRARAHGRGRPRRVVVRLERPAGAQRQEGDAGRILERHQRRLGREGGDRVGEPRRERRADPDHEVGLLQQARLGRPQRVTVRRGAGRQDQPGLADAGHHPRRDRLHRRDVGGDPRGGDGRGRQRRQRQGERGEVKRHGRGSLGGALWADGGATRIAGHSVIK